MLKRPLAPHEQRMTEAERKIRPIFDPIWSAACQRRVEMDLAMRARLRDLKERLPLLLLCRMKGGSGFTMARTLSLFPGICGANGEWRCWADAKLFQRGRGVSSGFSTCEKRRTSSAGFRFLGLVHTRGGNPRVTQRFESSLEGRGRVLVQLGWRTRDDFLIPTQDSNIALLGISLVRHEDELSVMLLAGENPPYRADDEVREGIAGGTAAPGKEAIKPDVSWTISDRIVPGLPDYSQIILLTRIYLASRRYDVRYVNLDEGQSYSVYTDDPAAISACYDRDRLLPNLMRMLHRYGGVFSALTALIYLPVYFIARQAEVVSTRFSTELNAQKNSAKMKRAFRVLGKQAVALHRQVKCLAGQSSSASEIRK